MDLCLPLLNPQISSLNHVIVPPFAVTLVLKEVNQYCALKALALLSVNILHSVTFAH